MEEEGGSSRLSASRPLLSQYCNTLESTWPPLSFLLDSGLRREMLHCLHTPLTHAAAGLKCFKQHIQRLRA